MAATVTMTVNNGSASSSGGKTRTNKDLIPIYTDWANHYLDKCHKKRLIQDLQKDMQDSLFLVDVIEAVTGQKVPDVKWKPKNQAQVVENIGTCLRFVEELGANVDGLTAKDIRDGQLKAILGLFFSLSRYKQQQKASAASNKTSAIPSSSAIPSPAHMSSAAADSKLSRLPSPFKSAKPSVNSQSNGSGIPSLHNSPAKQLPKTKDDSSRIRSPAGKNTGIPTPGSVKNSPLKTPTPSRQIQTPKQNAGRTSAIPPAQQNPKMLEKLKLFGSKDKSAPSTPRNVPNPSIPKSSTRTSNTSSSGFSSSKSEASDPPALAGVKTTTQTNNSPKAALKAFARRGLRSPKSPAKFGKNAKPETEKVSGSVQTSPQLLRKQKPQTNTGGPKALKDGRVSKSSEDTDADSAYAGFDSSSPTSSNAPSESGKTSGERRSPVGAPSPTPICSTSQLPTHKSPPAALKPTAAVKGVSWSKPSNLQKPSMIKPTSLPRNTSGNKLKPSNSNSEMSSTALKSEVLGKQMQSQQQSPTVGVVSPMTHHKTSVAVGSALPPKPLIRGSQESMASGHQSDSSASGSRDSDSVSVIYCPAACDSKSKLPSKPSSDKLKTSSSSSAGGASRTSSRLETTFDSSDGCVTQAVSSPSNGDSAGEEIKPMEPLVPRASPYAYLKGIGPGSLTHQVPSTQKSHLTLNRQIGSLLNTAVANENGMQVRSAAGEVSAGYVSDGDALTAALSGPLADLTSSELTSGYMSEGGISLYARKMQARFREGLEAVKDSMARPANPHDMMNDSFEDSSSLSSGISENIDDISTDDLTGSSLSDPQVAAALARESRPKQNGALAAQQLMLQQQQQQRMRGRRSDSGQQTEVAGGSSLQQRRLTEQENIDLLLQKCRTSARGMGAQPHYRPRSEQMNAPMTAAPSPRSQIGVYNSHTINGAFDHRAAVPQQRLQLSADGETLRVSTAPSFGRNRTPLKLVKADAAMSGSQPSSLTRPGSAQGQSMGSPAHLSGYHSLDRKRHLVGYCSESDTAYAVYGSPRHRLVQANSNQAALALVSPRRMPPYKECMSLPVSQQNSIVHENGDSWTAQAASLSNKSMSRSMIESQDIKPGQRPAMSPRLNGHHARLSIPPQAVADSLLCSSPRLNGVPQRKVSHPDGIYANLIQRTSTASMEMTEQSPTAMSAPAVSRQLSQPGPESPYMAGVLSKVGVAGPEAHGSSLSLASTSSSIYSTAEEKYQAEIRKLHREVEAYRDKVMTLTVQQNTYTSMMQAFEKALQGMVKRVETLQTQSMQKDEEVVDLRQKIFILRDMSAEAGINVEQIMRSDSPALQRRHTFTDQQNGVLVRQPSCESMASTVSQRSSVSTSSKGSKADKNSVNGTGFNRAKKSWIRSSISRAFSKGPKKKQDGLSDVDETSSQGKPAGRKPKLKSMDSGSRLEQEDTEVLKRELADKDVVLTDVRLEALTSAQQVDQLKEALNRLKNENCSLKHNNDRLARLTSTSRTGSQASLPLMSDGEYDSVSEYGSQAVSERNSMHLGELRDARRIMVSVSSNCSGRLSSMCPSESDMLIGSLMIGSGMAWDKLDNDVGALFNEYVHRIDPVGNLNLNSSESLIGYQLAETCRGRSEPDPSHSPLECINQCEQQRTLRLALRGVAEEAVDALSLETLVPKNVLQRLIRYLVDQRRLVLSGCCGTGKTYLAHKLAQYMVLRAGGCVESAIDTFDVAEAGQNVQAKLKQHLGKLVERTKQSQNCPLVFVIDNLHNVSDLSDIFQPLACLECNQGPYIIGTVNQSTQVSSLQVQHNFRFVVWLNQTEPVKGFLGRYLRRRLIQEECQRGSRYGQELHRVLEFVHKVWVQLNKFLEAANSPDVSIGPRVFLDCPMHLERSRQWFVKLWNGTLHPYLVQAVNEGQIYGRRTSLEEPTEYVCTEWPWIDGELPSNLLAKLSADQTDGDLSARDPLAILLRMRERDSRNHCLDANQL